MTEFRPRLRHGAAVFPVRCKKRIEGDLADDDNDLDPTKKSNLLDQIRPATIEFAARRLVPRRRAMHRRGNIAFAELQSIAAAVGVRLIGKACVVKRAVKPIAAAVAGEHPSGAIAAMGRWREADDQHASVWIAKARQRLCPVALAGITSRRVLSRTFTPAHQARASPAAGDPAVQFVERAHRIVLLAQGTPEKNLKRPLPRIQPARRADRTTLTEAEMPRLRLIQSPRQAACNQNFFLL